MRTQILAGALLAALALVGAGCDNCCRKTVPIRSNAPCCPPPGAAIVPAPPPAVSGYPRFEPATYRK